MTTPTYRGRPWWGNAMDPERERAARRTMAEDLDFDSGPAPRSLPPYNESVIAILAIERQVNDGHQISELGVDWR